jgi:hypothetical protein
MGVKAGQIHQIRPWPEDDRLDAACQHLLLGAFDPGTIGFGGET